MIKSDFAKNVLTLIGGTTIAQAIPIAISPILTRLYTPEDFGLLALFISITFIFSSFCTGRYELAIMLPRKDEDAINILALGLIINSLISIFVLIIIVLFSTKIAKLLGNIEIENWLYLVPITIFFIGLFNLLTYYNTRCKNYKDIAKATVLKSITLASIQLIVGVFKSGVSGLISAQILSQFVANKRLATNILKDKKLISSVSKKRIIFLAKEYKQFPKYSVPTGILFSLSKDMLNLIISAIHSVATLGLYTFAQKMLDMPFVLVGNSISQVFFQQASQEHKDKGNIKESFNAITKKLIIIATPIFTLLYFFVEDIFAFVFGEEWRVAGEYAKILIPLSFLHFVATSVSTTFDIFNGLKTELLWQIVVLVGSLVIVYFSKESLFKDFLYAYMFFSCFMYALLFYLAYRLTKGEKSE